MPSQIRLHPAAAVLVALSLPVLLGLGAVVAAFLSRTATPSAQQPLAAAAPDPALDVPAPAGLLVEVTGAVARPGLYRLQRGERVEAAIAIAGGFTDLADSARLPDLAARLRDGQQIRVPIKK